MKTRAWIIISTALFCFACDGALTVGEPVGSDVPTQRSGDGEVGTAESVDPILWDGAAETYKSPFKSCAEKGRWARECVNDDGCCPSYCSADNDNDCTASEPDPPDPGPTCGDGLIDEGETCDGDCPQSCDAPEACTIATMSGSADTCDAVCEMTEVTACAGGDDCCPMGCTNDNDSDCPVSEPDPFCGDGAVDPGEVCDGDCPTSCSAPDACTTAALSGDANTCDAMCEYSAITACASGDGCCPSGCTFDNDQDCPEPPPNQPPTVDCTDPGTWPQSWSNYEAEVITLVNQHRAAGADCGSQGTFAAAGPVQMNVQMQQASRCHSMDMDVNGYFSHTGQDGSSFVTRLNEAGYGGSPRGENIAAGYSSPSSVVGGWMASDGHCRNIMNGGIDRMGVGYTNESRSTWTMTTGIGD